MYSMISWIRLRESLGGMLGNIPSILNRRMRMCSMISWIRLRESLGGMFPNIPPILGFYVHFIRYHAVTDSTWV
jgi:hypothetical protein